MSKNTVDANQLLAALLNAIYWTKFTPKQQDFITNIINDAKLDNMAKATEICDVLGIERRGNRANIYSILNSAAP